MKLPSWLAGKTNKQAAIDEYNLGLEAKYRAEWKASLTHNQRAASLNGEEQATWWNLGIAATALRDWEEARRAWRAYGITVNDGPGEVLMAQELGCVRLNPTGAAEVVWGTRIDPARILVANVPLPESGRRCGDIVLHDGASAGYRKKDDQEYPVFDELEVWRVSDLLTFEGSLVTPNEDAFQRLVVRFQEEQLGIEDWGTMRILCEACDRGRPGEHTCGTGPGNWKKFGFAAKSESALRQILREWIEVEDGASVEDLRLVLGGVN